MDEHGGTSSYCCMARRPDLFIGRHQLARVRDVLCRAAESGVSGAAVGITTALHGAGGFGKTTLAQQVCFDERIRRAYPDGILWLTLGERVSDADRLRHVLTLLQVFTRQAPPAFPDAVTAAVELRQRLAGKRVLLVLDDLWHSMDLQPFLGLERGPTVLVTTRDARTLPDTCEQITVDAMEHDESMSLLSRSLPAVDVTALRRLVERLGRWPLLLCLVNRQLHQLIKKQACSPQDAMAIVERRLDGAGIIGFDIGSERERARAVRATVEVSLQQLADEQMEGAGERGRACYERMAVFPEDTDIPLPVLAQYWGMAEHEAEMLCDRLFAMSLLLWRYEQGQGKARLHDVFRQYLLSASVSKDRLAALHRALLAALCPPSGLWWDLPEDALYAWQHVAYHMREAGQNEELLGLIWEPGWLVGKLGACGPAELIADFAYVSEDADTARLRGALELSSHVLAKDINALPSQLTGRLLGFADESPRIRSLLDQLRRAWPEPWLCPLTPSLTPPGGPLIRTLIGHSRTVNAVAVTPDGKHAISASSDKTLKVWDLDSGSVLRTLQGHSRTVTAVAVTPDGKYAISASGDHLLKVWDLDSGSVFRTLFGLSDRVIAVAVSPDGKHAITAFTDYTMKVWDLDSGSMLRTLSGHSDMVNAVAVTPDGKYAISASSDRTLKLWDLDGGREIRTLSGHSRWVTAVAVMPDGKRAISASSDRTVKVWDLSSGRELSTFIGIGHSERVMSVAVTSDCKLAVSASYDKTLRVWDLDSGSMIRTLSGHSHWVMAVALTPDGKRAISASADSTLKVWDLAYGSSRRTFSGHSYSVTALTVTPDGKRAISASADSTLRIWDLDSGSLLRTLSGHNKAVHAVAVTPDGKYAISASRDRSLKVWNLDTGALIRTLSGITITMNDLALTPDGKLAIFASNDGALQVWDLSADRKLHTLSNHTDSVYAVAVTPDGERAISASHDHTLKVWDLKAGTLLRTLHGHSRPVYAVKAMPDSKRAISASHDKTLRVWDLSSGHELRTLSAHSSSVNAAAITPNGRLIISASSDHTLKLWDLDSGQGIVSFHADAQMVACAIHPTDLQRVIAGDSLGRVHFLALMEPDVAPAPPPAPDRDRNQRTTPAPTVSELKQRLETEFSLHELELLVADAFPESGGLDHIVAAVHPLPKRVHELVMHCRRRGWLERLAAAIVAAREPKPLL